MLDQPWHGQQTNQAGNELLIGISEEGRPLQVTYLGEPTAPLRVLLLAGQHGDEAPATEAANTFIAAYEQRSPLFPAIHLAVLPCLNPDGAAHGTRRNAHGVDLNRDHQRLRSAEVQALHCFVRHWRPHLVVDMHTYPPRRKHLLRQNLVHCHDLFLDVPTHPAIHHAWPADLPATFLDTLITQLSAAGYYTNRYTLVQPSGKVRHSTPAVVDARNGLALRYGLFTLLVEGRHPHRRDPAEAHTRRQRAFQAVLEQILHLAQQHQAALCAVSPTPQPGDAIPVRTRRSRADGACTLLFTDKKNNVPRLVTLAGPYQPVIKTKKYATLPAAYAVPQSEGELVTTLQRHGFHYQPLPAATTVLAQPIAPAPLITTKASPLSDYQPTALTNYLLFRTDQVGGQTLALYLEPNSSYRLTKQPAPESIQAPVQRVNGCDYSR